MKKLFTAVCFSAVLLLGFTPAAHADEASKQAKAAKLVATMHMEKNMSQMMDLIAAQMQQSMTAALGDNATPKQKEIFNDFMGKVFQLMQSQLSWPVLKPDMVKLYADNFSEEELDGLNTFYASPVGQSSLEKMPMITRQSMTAVQSHIASLEPQMKALQEDFAKQIAATMPPAGTSSEPAKSGTTPKK